MSEITLPDYYHISGKRERGQRFAPGLLSNAFHGFEAPGQIVQVSHPRGHFFLSSVRKSSLNVLIADGVVSRSSCILNEASYSPGLRHENHGGAGLLQEITEASRIDLQRLNTHRILNDPRTEYYICRLSPFLKTVKSSLLIQAVGPSQIRMEVFGPGGFVETASRPRSQL
ncbi:hypothetical protein TSTA_117150 [Talaromyces stipitatus ATCC 10500]|uniref:Uncharacterized protein n=1 Tax=Talaromyces stipitatus (strain ATCC 10500 / CBS 375.48 / QM 6759 / NRRL 1006) TaxID=441959 RepID=B8MDG6_TALSN|nr:uncharacterized protein TSTA_117150 [Talaromyces stipitatus ATCC 10500]EED17929.1 hypothetical protein TSTA_117150 [Talaromyces stipitatus ATCC 10500]